MSTDMLWRLTNCRLLYYVIRHQTVSCHAWGLGVRTKFFEYMGLIICPNLRRNSEGGMEGGGEGNEKVTEYRLRKD